MENIEEFSNFMDAINTPTPQAVTVKFHKVTESTRFFSDIMLVDFQPGFVVFIKEDEGFTALPADEIKEIVAVTLLEEEDED